MLTLITKTTGRKGLYRCACGAETEAFTYNAKSGHTSSCGCIRKSVTSARSTTHGHKPLDGPSRTYAAWVGMRQRCNNPSRADLKNYGGRGIYHCPRWINFEVFLADMGECPAGLTLDREDTQGHYYPSNCRWVTRAVQNLNKRNCVRYEHDGKSQTLAEWARETGIGRVTLLKRIQRGVPMALALTTRGYLSMPTNALLRIA